jgi:hypothetical protein
MSAIKERGKNGKGFPCFSLHVPAEHIVPGLEVNFHTSEKGLHIGGEVIPWFKLLEGQVQPGDPENGRPEVWRVGECWSSARPHESVLCLAIGVASITRHENHDSFIRWITPYQINQLTPRRRS